MNQVYFTSSENERLKKCSPDGRYMLAIDNDGVAAKIEIIQLKSIKLIMFYATL